MYKKTIGIACTTSSLRQRIYNQESTKRFVK